MARNSLVAMKRKITDFNVRLISYTVQPILKALKSTQKSYL